MTVAAWRIVKRRHADTAFDGYGAWRYGGRWNLRGTSVVYTGGSRAMAALEMLVHLRASDLADAYTLIEVVILKELIEHVPPEELPPAWHAEPAPAEVQQFGSDWAASRRSCVLRVPSAIIPDEFNYLLNPAHPRFAELVVGTSQPFAFDRRLMKS